MNAFDAMRSRRTIRRFTEENVTDAQVATLIEMATYAPSRLNRRPWHFVVLRDPDVKRDLAHLLRVRPYLEQAPVIVAVVADPDLSPTWLQDTAAATENMLLAATALELGGAWVGAPASVMLGMAQEYLQDRAGIPNRLRLASLVAIGHPAKAPQPHTREKSLEIIKVHEGQWGNQPPW